MNTTLDIMKRAKAAAPEMAVVSEDKKNEALNAMADMLLKAEKEILEANKGGTDLVLMGIPRRGYPLARRLAAKIADADPTVDADAITGQLDVTMFRDDLAHQLRADIADREDAVLADREAAGVLRGVEQDRLDLLREGIHAYDVFVAPEQQFPVQRAADLPGLRDRDPVEREVHHGVGRAREIPDLDLVARREVRAVADHGERVAGGLRVHVGRRVRARIDLADAVLEAVVEVAVGRGRERFVLGLSCGGAADLHRISADLLG